MGCDRRGSEGFDGESHKEAKSALRPSWAKYVLALVVVGLTSGIARVEWRALSSEGLVAEPESVFWLARPKSYAPRMAIFGTTTHGNKVSCARARPIPYPASFSYFPAQALAPLFPFTSFRKLSVVIEISSQALALATPQTRNPSGGTPKKGPSQSHDTLMSALHILRAAVQA